MNPSVVLSVAGTDSGGAAGLAADLATFAALGVHGAAVVTAVTAQDTTGVHAVHRVPLDVVEGQLDAVLGDLPVAAVKTGMLGSPEVVRLVADRVVLSSTRHGATSTARPVVVDPVLVSTSGSVLGDEAVVAAYVERLLPVATVITPNLDEARALVGSGGASGGGTGPDAGSDAGPEELAAELASAGPTVLLTGGPEWRPDEPTTTCTDWLAVPGKRPVALVHPAVPTTSDHGTGCTFSAALAAYLARGRPPEVAARAAAAFTTGQLAAGRAWTLGRGRGPIAHTHHHAEEQR